MRTARQSLSILSFALLAACARPGTVSPQATPLEIQAEAARQTEYLKNARARGLVHAVEASRPVVPRVKAVAARIAPAAVAFCRETRMTPDPRDCAFDIFIKRGRDGDVLNAYADGKSVYISSGMARFTRDDNELALILAHETAHNLMRHVDAQKKNALAGLFVGAMADALAARYGYGSGSGDFAQVGAGAATLAYSPSFEREADYIGLYLAARAGYDYHGVPALWRRMSLENPDAIYAATTHPSNPERYVVMRKIIAEIDAKRAKGLALLPERLSEAALAPSAGGK